MIDEKSREYQILKSLLTENEKVGVEVVERRLGGAPLLHPLHAYATNQRIIIIKGGIIFGIHQDFKVINYKNITEIKLERGIKFCRLHFSLEGEMQEGGATKWLVGLRYKDALEMIRFVNEMEAKPVEEKRIM